MAPVQSRLRHPKTKHPGRKYQLEDGTPVELETLYLVDHHPQRPGTGKTYVYYQDTTPEGLAETWEQEKNLKTPRGTFEQIKQMGYLELEEGDAVFARSLQGIGDPNKDVIQVWVASGQLVTAEMKADLDSARDRILGDRSLRNRKRPKKNHEGVLTGGTAYERSSVAKSVKPPARVYTAGPSLEQPTLISQPVASSKVKPDGSMDPALGDRAFLLQAVTAIAMAAMYEGPLHVQDAIKRRAELVNKPQIGSERNWGYATSQVNLATSSLAADAGLESTTLVTDLGWFGGAHADRHDAPGWYSNMTCNHDIPDDYDEGMFFILQLGVFVRLKRYSSINFFGHRQHGGTPPLCPDGTPLYKFAYRFVVISYPPQRAVNGTARITLCALPNNEALIVPPEVLHVNCDNRTKAGWSPAPSTTRSTFIREGLAMMTPASILTMTVHWLLLLMFYILQQLPASLKIQMDPDLIIQAITYERDGQRINIGPWEQAPGHRRLNQRPWNYNTGDGSSTNQSSVRSAAWVSWQEYEDHVATHVPYLGRKGRVRAELSRPKKTAKMMQSDSELEYNGSSESSIDSNADSDDEGIAAKRIRKAERERARVVEQKEQIARARKEKAEAKTANGTKKGKKSKPKIVDADDTASGVSWDEGLNTGDRGKGKAGRPTADRDKAENPGKQGDGEPNDAWADRAAARDAIRAGNLAAADPVVSEKSLGKRKEAPPPDPADNISEQARLRHGPTLRSTPGYATRAKTAGWSHAAASASEDIDMGDISHTRRSG